jgi:hypothetical protein
LNVGGYQFNRTVSGVTCAFGVLSRVEVRWRKIVGPVKCQFSVASQVPGDLGECVDVGSQRGRKLLTMGLKDTRHVVDARWFDERGPEQRLEGEFDYFLGLANYVCPTLGLEQHVDGAESCLCPSQMVSGEVAVSHRQ